MAELPDWQPFDGVAPPIPTSGPAGRVVAIVATEKAVTEGWAPTAAVEMARGWSNSGRRVILIDGGLARPTLHDAVGIPNREGLTDATFHGASVARVSRPVDDGAFYLITAGAPVADVRAVAKSPRWHRLASGITEAGATAALFVRDGDACTAGFLGSASDIVVLSSGSEPAPTSVRDLEPLVRGVTGRPDQGRARGAVAELGTDAAALRTTSAATPVRVGGGGARTMILFVVLAVVLAAVLGYLLTSGI